MSAQRLGLNGRGVACENMEEEIVAINFSTGVVFSLTGTGAEIWRLLLQGHGRDAVASAYAQQADDSGVRAQIEGFIAALIEAELLVPLDAAPVDEPPTVGQFSAPVLEKFDDMAELFQLDPIHEVSDRGWPHTVPHA
jgi:hypothetical protein